MTPLEIIRLTATEFAQMPDTTLNQWIEMCTPLVSRKKFGNLYAQALVAVVCHRMKMSGLGAADGFGTIADAARVSSYSEGSRSVSFNGGQNADGEDWELTIYGKNFLTLRRLAIVPITITGCERE